jgi:flagellar hook-length control protein FliK
LSAFKLFDFFIDAGVTVFGMFFVLNCFVNLFMTGASVPIDISESLTPQAAPQALEQNFIPFDNLLTNLQSTSQNNPSHPHLHMFFIKNEKNFPDDLSESIKGNKKIDSNKVERNSSACSAFLSSICNFLYIAGNLLMEMEKGSKQSFMMNNTEGTFSYTVESRDRNTLQNCFLQKDAQISNTTPLLVKNGQKQANGLQPGQGMMPPEDAGPLRNNSIETQLFEAALKSQPENEVLFSLEQYEPELLTDKEANYIKPVQMQSPLLKDPSGAASSKTNGNNYINTGFRTNQFMILQGDMNNNAHTISGKLYQNASVDTGSSSSSEAQGNWLIHSEVTDTSKYSVLKNEDPKINSVPHVADGEGKSNTGLREKLHITDTKGFSPLLFEEIQSPDTPASLKLPAASKTVPLIVNPLKSEESRDKGHGKTTYQDTVIIQAEDTFFLVDNKNRNEHSPLQINTLQEPPHADTFVLPKKGDASIEVSLEPEGMGQIDIELTLDRGVINAQINTSESIGKEIIERNLYAILSSLIDEGLSIGSFSVSLRNRQGNINDNSRKEAANEVPAIKTVQTPLVLSQNRIISIFV